MFQSILLVDDHAAILEGLRNVLTARYPKAAFHTAASVKEARWIFSREQPDLIILDLNIGQESGLDLIQALRTEAPDSRTVVYSLHPETEFGVAALRAGAFAYVTKDRPMAELLEALRTVEAGRRYINPQFAESLANAIATDSGSLEARPLSERESQILKMMAEGRALKQIAGDLGVSIKTVSTYRARILEKLGLSTTADLIRYALVQKI